MKTKIMTRVGRFAGLLVLTALAILAVLPVAQAMHDLAGPGGGDQATGKSVTPILRRHELLAHGRDVRPGRTQAFTQPVAATGATGAGAAATASSGTSAWTWIAVGLGAAVLAEAIVILILARRRRKAAAALASVRAIGPETAACDEQLTAPAGGIARAA